MHSVLLSDTPRTVWSGEQNFPRSIQDLIPNFAVTEPNLQFAPSWSIETAIDREKKASHSQNKFEDFDTRSLPERTKIFSSRHFF